MQHNIDVDRLRRLVVQRDAFASARRELQDRIRTARREIERCDRHLDGVNASPLAGDKDLQRAERELADAREALAGLQASQDEADERFSVVARLANAGLAYVRTAGVCPADLAEDY